MSQKRSKGTYDGKIAGLYDLEETIGRGHYAVVKLARHVFTGEKVAVKVIDKTKLDAISKAHLFQEVRCMKLVQHPNVVRLYEVIDTQTKLYLILELGDGGDMYDYIMKHESGLDEETARRYFRQIVQAIRYCHQLHVVHRDLKPENVVFFKKLGMVKLTDFGFSNKFTPGSKLETSCGSLAYSAPEILLGDSYDAPSVDVWSLGVILYMLVTGEAPFQEANDSETLTMIMDCKYIIPSHVSPECHDLVKRMLIRDPAKRASLESIWNHKWVTQGKSTPVPLLPLISREQISEEDHNYIIQRMVDGAIASREEIMKSIEKDAYNHITATYYLLAEKRLKKQENLTVGLLPKSPNPTTTIDGKLGLAPLSLSPSVKSSDKLQGSTDKINVDSLLSPPGTHLGIPQGASAMSIKSMSSEISSSLSRICSVIEEDFGDEPEKMEQDPANEKTLQHSRSQEDAYNSDDSSNSTDSSKSPVKTAPRRSNNIRPLHSVRSSPQLLNQIFEEGESDDDLLPLKRKMSPSGAAKPTKLIPVSPDVIRKFEQKKRGSKGTSCSSSDASDTDDAESKRKEKLKQKLHRRDSSDNSSDTDGPSGPGGFGSAGGRAFGGGGGGGGRQQDRDRKDRDKNDENKRSQDKSSGHKGGKQNGSVQLGKRELKRIDDVHTTVTNKVENLSIGSNTSNSCENMYSTRYMLSTNGTLHPSDCNATPHKTARKSPKRDVQDLNEENKKRTSSKTIYVRSKNFSDLMDRFNTKDDLGSNNKELGIHFRRRSKTKMKTDINRNGLVARADGTLEEDKCSVDVETIAKTKCCSLV